MLSRYDATQAARVDCDFARKWDTTQNARVDCEFVRAYDDTEAAWIDKLKKYFELAVTSNFYNNSGNIAFCIGDTFHCEVKPTGSNVEITATIEEEFTDPTIQADYSFGYSDECPSIASGFMSHACVQWIVRGYLNGSLMRSETLASGNQYAYTTVFNQPISIPLVGTFDKLQFVCEVRSMSTYEKYGRANTNLDNIRIDGKLYEGKSSIDSY